MGFMSLIKHSKVLNAIFRTGVIHPLCYINPTLATELIYFISTGKKLNLKNPQTFNEKIQYLKLNSYYNNPDVTMAVDKYRIRDYLTETVQCRPGNPLMCCLGGGTVYVNELLGEGFYESVDDIDFQGLPKQFVLKCNHDSGSVVVCKDKDALDIKLVKKKLRKALKRNYWLDNAECQYKFVKKGIICERYLEDGNGCLVDYKFYCFNGEPKIIYCTNPHIEGELLEMAFFDMEFKKLDIHRANTKEMIRLPEKPVLFEKMKEIARELSRPFPFVRVDEYICEGKIYLGEMTFIPTGGIQKFVEPGVDEMLGEWLKI